MPDKTRALIIGKGTPSAGEVRLTRRTSTETLVSSILVGICRTDIAAARGAIPCAEGIVFGHEYSALVEESDEFEKGVLVAGGPFREGKFRGLWTDGVCSEYALVENDTLQVFPKGFSREVAALLEPVCASIAPWSVLPKDVEGAAVVGNGRLAKLAALALSERTECVLLSPDEARESDRRFSFVVETCAALPGALDVCVALCSEGGTVCVKSRNAEKVFFDTGKLLSKNVSIRPALYGDWSEARLFCERNESVLRDLCGKVFNFEDWREALSVAGGGEEKKIFVRAPRGGTCAD